MFTMPALLACWSVCIVLSIMDLYYLKMGKSWAIYDQQLMESKAWWICGIPLSVYSLLAEISLLIATSFSYMKTKAEVEFEDGERFKEFRSYNSNYAYSNLYDSAESYTSSILSWIDSIGIWNRIVFMMTNFIAIVSCYYLCVGLLEYNTKSVTFLLKTSVIGLALVLTWLPGVLSTYSESFKLFGIVLGSSIVFVFMMYSKNYQISGKVRGLASEVMNIRKLSKGDEIINRRIIERYVESGGKLYTITTSPAAIATELEWGRSAIQVLKDNNSYFDCNFDQNRSSWTSCVEEKITTYPTWLIGDKFISGLVSPKTIAHMVNINMKELSQEVLALVHPDDRKEIEDRVSDSEDLSTETGSGEDLDSVESQSADISKDLSSVSFGEGNVDLVAKELEEGVHGLPEGSQKEDKSGKKKSVTKKHRKKKQKVQLAGNEEVEEKLAESMYDQPSFRGMTILNKLEANSRVGTENSVDLIEKEPREDESQGQSLSPNPSPSWKESEGEGLALPSKEEFDAFSEKISKRNEDIIKESQEMERKAESEIMNIENNETEPIVGTDLDSETVPDPKKDGLDDSKNEFTERGSINDYSKLVTRGERKKDLILDTKSAIQETTSPIGEEQNPPEHATVSSGQKISSDSVVSEMIQSEENE